MIAIAVGGLAGLVCVSCAIWWQEHRTRPDTVSFERMGELLDGFAKNAGNEETGAAPLPGRPSPRSTRPQS